MGGYCGSISQQEILGALVLYAFGLEGLGQSRQDVCSGLDFGCPAQNKTVYVHAVQQIDITLAFV